MDEYLIVDNYINKYDKNTIEYNEFDHENQILITQKNSQNTDSFHLKKKNIESIYIDFSFFKINNVYYININNSYIIDYKKFLNIQKISQFDKNSLKIINTYIGEIIIEHCNIELFEKTLQIIARYMNKRTSIFSDIIYYFLQ